MGKPALLLADIGNPDECRKNREFVAKEWAEWDKALDEKQIQNQKDWEFINHVWLTRLRESHDRMDNMARYCKGLEALCHHLERRLTAAEDTIHTSKVFDTFSHIYMPQPEAE